MKKGSLLDIALIIFMTAKASATRDDLLEHIDTVVFLEISQHNLRENIAVMNRRTAGGE